jgi:hypothetical protein
MYLSPCILYMDPFKAYMDILILSAAAACAWGLLPRRRRRNDLPHTIFVCISQRSWDFLIRF